MLSYLMCLFYLSAISIADNVEIQSRYYDVKDMSQHYNYQVVNGEKIDLKVYYESLCPDCVRFHTGSLLDTYKKIGSYIDLKTYPYGKAQRNEENDKTEIMCQHGPEECYGNKLHACAIDILNNVSQSVVYTSCMMSSQWGGWGSTDMDAVNCGQSLGIESKPIIECAKSQRGEDLLEYYGKETDKLSNLSSVPWVLVNGEWFDSDNDLMKKICKTLTNPPPPCAEYF